jgi:hypothetical protein
MHVVGINIKGLGLLDCIIRRQYQQLLLQLPIPETGWFTMLSCAWMMQMLPALVPRKRPNANNLIDRQTIFHTTLTGGVFLLIKPRNENAIDVPMIKINLHITAAVSGARFSKVSIVFLNHGEIYLYDKAYLTSFSILNWIVMDWSNASMQISDR